ncbi:MAG TPA: M23 family metallopeptidase [Spirochaetia bacterium]|nr:M23 family metallopeptidase [Spirochaetia bacterium]
MGEPTTPVVVSFPLRGEWVALHTPARRIPSHGTNALGQRYAFDLLRTDSRGGFHFFSDSVFRYLSLGVPIERCYCWREPVYAPFDGDVVAAEDGSPERGWVHPVLDLLYAIGETIAANVKGRLFGPGKVSLHAYIGNYVILKHGDIYALFAHLHTHSVAVCVNQPVRQGEVLGAVGHTGISTAPHLHFQLMDSGDLFVARGIPCAFTQYQVCEHGHWESVTGGIPGYRQRIRCDL